MTRKYIRKTVDRYSKDDIDRAISLVRDEKVAVCIAAQQLNILKRTSYNRLANTNGASGRVAKSILTKGEESMLIHTITVFQQWQQPLSRLSLIQLARDYITRLNKPISTNSTLYDWFESFMNRHREEIKIVKSMKLEKIRSTSCTGEVIGRK
jgi:hypothetical protein